MPRNVSAPMTPSARGRPAPGNRCDAAEVATGTSAPPPTAWTSRAAISSSSVGAMPASRLPEREHDERAEEQAAVAPQVGQAPGQRHRDDVDQQVAVDDPGGLAQAGPAGEVGDDRGQGDRRDHELEAGEEHAGAQDGEQDEAVAARRVAPRARV